MLQWRCRGLIWICEDPLERERESAARVGDVYIVGLHGSTQWIHHLPFDPRALEEYQPLVIPYMISKDPIGATGMKLVKNRRSYSQIHNEHQVVQPCAVVPRTSSLLEHARVVSYLGLHFVIRTPIWAFLASLDLYGLAR